MQEYGIAIQGGAGTILRGEMTHELEQAYIQALQEALDAGYSLLESGGSAIEAVTASTIALENNVLFNAGRGSVFTRKGIHEMDAAIMDGLSLRAGAVAGVRNIRNPIELAKKVMESSDHVLLSGLDAVEFAIKHRIEMEPDEYFFSQFRYDQWKSIRDSDNYMLDHSVEEVGEKKFGTVGAVACDGKGNLAAATSTGGMTNKKYGRIGDSAIIGCGTYANNATCAVSCTGHGELFIRCVAAYDVSCLMEYRGFSLQQACEEVVLKKLPALRGEGGLIAVSPQAHIAMVFNSEGMYRARKTSQDAHSQVAIYR